MIARRRMVTLATVACLFFFNFYLPVECDSTLNYCDPSLCNGKKHVACGVQALRFGTSCSIDAAVVDLTPFLQELVLDNINSLRNKVASGEVLKSDPATHMGTMVWDKELAYLAKLNVLHCKQHRDLCLNTALFKNVGQTVAYRGFKNSVVDPEEQLEYLVKLWAKEEKLVTSVDMLEYKGNSGKPAQNFMQLVLQNCNRVGCALLQQSRNDWIQLYFTCNYAYGPKLGEPIYDMGSKSGEACQSGKNPKYSKLCSVSEQYTGNANVTEEPEVAENSPTFKRERKLLEDKTYIVRGKFARLMHEISQANKLANNHTISIDTLNHEVHVNQGSSRELNSFDRRMKHVKEVILSRQEPIIKRELVIDQKVNWVYVQSNSDNHEERDGSNWIAI